MSTSSTTQTVAPAYRFRSNAVGTGAGARLVAAGGGQYFIDLADPGDQPLVAAVPAGAITTQHPRSALFFGVVGGGEPSRRINKGLHDRAAR